MYEDLEATTCRLIRQGGEEWTVQELELTGSPPWARVVMRPEEDEAEREPREVRLVRGDRLEWRRADGSVAWATRLPVTRGNDSAGERPAGAPSAGAA